MHCDDETKKTDEFGKEAGGTQISDGKRTHMWEYRRAELNGTPFQHLTGSIGQDKIMADALGLTAVEFAYMSLAFCSIAYHPSTNSVLATTYENNLHYQPIQPEDAKRIAERKMDSEYYYGIKEAIHSNIPISPEVLLDYEAVSKKIKEYDNANDGGVPSQPSYKIDFSKPFVLYRGQSNDGFVSGDDFSVVPEEGKNVLRLDVKKRKSL